MIGSSVNHIERSSKLHQYEMNCFCMKIYGLFSLTFAVRVPDAKVFSICIRVAVSAIFNEILPADSSHHISPMRIRAIRGYHRCDVDVRSRKILSFIVDMQVHAAIFCFDDRN